MCCFCTDNQGYDNQIQAFPQGSFSSCRYPNNRLAQRKPYINNWHIRQSELGPRCGMFSYSAGECTCFTIYNCLRGACFVRVTFVLGCKDARTLKALPLNTYTRAFFFLYAEQSRLKASVCDPHPSRLATKNLVWIPRKQQHT